MLTDIHVSGIDLFENDILNNSAFPIYELNTKVSKRLAGLKQIKMDLFIVRDTFKELSNAQDREDYFLKHIL